MTLKLSPIANAVTADVITDFEDHIKQRLPTAYFDFLLKFNGGRPDQDMFPIAGFEDQTSSELMALYGLNTKVPAYDLLNTYKWFEGRIPSRFLAIGSDGGGNYVCFELNAGYRVVFWDHRHFWGTGEWRESDVYFIAPNFDAFLASLEPHQP